MRSALRTVDRRWAMTIAVRPGERCLERRLHVRLVLVVEVARRLVEDHDRRVLQQQARDREPLLLAAGQAVPALADDRGVPVGQRRDRVVDAGRRGRRRRAPRRWRRDSRSAGSPPIDSWNRCGSWDTTPIAGAQRVRVRSRTSTPSISTAPDVTS